MKTYSPVDEMSKKFQAKRKETYSPSARLFEWLLVQIWPKTDSMLEKPRRGLRYVTILIMTIRRKTYYPILDAWSSYCHGIEIDEEGLAIERARIRLTGFILGLVWGFIRYPLRWVYTKTGLAQWICKRYGHKLIDMSWASPDSGNMDHECLRCGEYWKATLF